MSYSARPAPQVLHPLAKPVRKARNATVKDVLALDFETANQRRSACSLGMVRMVNDEIVYKKHFLIDPEDDFEDTSFWVHGIKPEEVAGAPLFPQVAKEIFAQVAPTTLLLAHNAKFDMNVLHKGLARYGTATTPLPFLCTVKLSEAFFSDVPSCNLAALSQRLSYDLQHHNALSDALGALTVYKHIGDTVQAEGGSIFSFLQRTGMREGVVSHDVLRHVKSAAGKLYKLPEAFGPHARAFEGKAFCFAGDLTYWNKKQAERMVTDRGGVLKSRMSKQVDYFVVGNRGFFTSPEEWEARKLRVAAFSATSSLQVLQESDFVNLMQRQLAKERLR